MEYIDTSALLAALTSSIATTLINYRLMRSREKQKQKTDLKTNKIRLARAFWAEITALFALYEGLKLVPWDPPEKEIDYNMLNIQYDYLSIFNSNADKIGLFPHEDAVEFIDFYTFAKSYIDSLRELSRRWINHVAREEQKHLNPKNDELKEAYNTSRKDLFKLYQRCYEQQDEFYRRRDVVKKTFEKYL